MAFILGTAGHIDHGKTSLVYALTGVDCDRLQEEKERGITIELGFAKAVLPNGASISIIDVPGHERFVKQMVSGVFAMQAVLLIISAEEGIMPQTKEHLDIITLLGIPECIVVITKCDLVSEEWLMLIKEQVQDFLTSTPYKESMCIACSVKNGKGMDIIHNALMQLEKKHTTTESSMPFRMPIDRVFTIKGHGTVVTGSVISGNIVEKETVMRYPAEEIIKIKSIQNHNLQTTEGMQGTRTALNLHNIRTNEIEKGDVIAEEGSLMPSLCWEVYIHCLQDSPVPIKHLGEIHFHHQTREVLAKVYLLDKEKKIVEPGQSALCLLQFSDAMVGVAGDKAIIRSCSPLRTIAGCILTNPLPNTKGMLSKKALQEEYSIALSSVQHAMVIYSGRSLYTEMDTINIHKKSHKHLLQDLVLFRSTLAQEEGLSLQECSLLTNISMKELEKLLKESIVNKTIVEISSKNYISYTVYMRHKESVKQYIQTAIMSSALNTTFTIAQLYTGYKPQISKAFLDSLVQDLVVSGIFIKNNEYLQMPEKKVFLSPQQEQIKNKVIEKLIKQAFMPSSISEFSQDYKIPPKELLALLYYLQEQGEVVRITEDIWYSKTSIEEIHSLVYSFFTKNTQLTIANFKDMCGGLSRKYTVPLLEYLDREKITMRVGEYRVLR